MAISWCAKRKGGPAKRERAMGTLFLRDARIFYGVVIDIISMASRGLPWQISWCAKRKGGPAKRERAMGTSGGLRPMSISMFGDERLCAYAARGSRTHAGPPRGSVSARVNLQLGQRRSCKERKKMGLWR